MDEGSLSKKYKIGSIAFIVLLLIEIIEYIVGVKITSGNFLYMVLLSVPGSWVIIRYFMHSQQLIVPPTGHDPQEDN
jgi:hypothetical protein|tara:strand:- start:652 stop:882 length:231 start_codon:yes stop_codon:yes gene_type:complete